MIVLEYEARFAELSKYTPHIVADERRKAKKFVMGLRPSLRTWLVKMQPVAWKNLVWYMAWMAKSADSERSRPTLSRVGPWRPDSGGNTDPPTGLVYKAHCPDSGRLGPTQADYGPTQGRDRLGPTQPPDPTLPSMLLKEFVDESNPDPDKLQIEHLLQTVEAICRDYLDEEWLHLIALIYGIWHLHASISVSPLLVPDGAPPLVPLSPPFSLCLSMLPAPVLVLCSWNCRCGSHDHWLYALDYAKRCCVYKISCGGSPYGSPSIDMEDHRSSYLSSWLSSVARKASAATGSFLLFCFLAAVNRPPPPILA
ncbi:hypothetical protein Taro_025188, partial [Colocasia esculenta]|nr:hypothetical protein [Colocasia esculenta]